MYGVMPEDVSGQSVIESVEHLYISFASALETMTLNTTCRCNACANIDTLGLKIVMHCGEFLLGSIGGRETLSGPDVILAHRLLKNHVTERTGIGDYMLVTEACVEDLGVAAIVAGWAEHTEEYEHVGEVKGYVSSLSDIWEFVKQQKEDKVLERDAWLTMSAHTSAPPGVIWDHLIDPVKRTRWLDANDNEVRKEALPGRIGPGTEYHCAHGEDEVSLFTVLDMRPLDYLTLLVAEDDTVMFKVTDYVIPSGAGTRLINCCAAPQLIETGKDVSEEVKQEMMAFFSDFNARALERLIAMAEEATAAIPA